MKIPRLLVVPLGAGLLLAFAAAAGAAPRPAGSSLALQAAHAAPPAASAATFVGADTCIACHGEVAEHLAETPHGKAAFGRLSAQGCETCHGPGSAHAESGDPAEIRNPIRLRGTAADAACLSCHDNRGSQANWHGGIHEVAGLNCVDCHSVHQAAPPRRAARLLEAPSLAGSRGATRTTEICLSCHTAHRKGLAQRSSHPLREGRMDCASCHDPHGTPGEHLTRADSVNDLCLSCHQEKRGPFLWEHSPVREDCLTCHTPHGSNQPQLLAVRINQLCQSCHLQGRHQTVAGLPAAMWNTNRNCLNCHPQIHGSNHPSGVLFQR
jgi:DmsE family decaheme c-type cytochrome